MKSSQWKMKTQVGTLYLVASDSGLQKVGWEKQSEPMLSSLRGSDPVSRILSQTVHQLEEYFRGERKKFDLPLEIEGTSFQQKVWKVLTKIPYGKTRSYKEVAVLSARQKAYRAVGTANGRNPLCIVVPCHRVIASDGTLGGFSGGLGMKGKLLNLEKHFASLARH